MLTGGRGDAITFALKMSGLVLTMLPHAYTIAKRERYLKQRARDNYPDYRLNINGDPNIVH